MSYPFGVPFDTSEKLSKALDNYCQSETHDEKENRLRRDSENPRKKYNRETDPNVMDYCAWCRENMSIDDDDSICSYNDYCDEQYEIWETEHQDEILEYETKIENEINL